ncbi:MAG: tetratricopeptide repeat protein [Kouleothrix sp.]|nr:tetratricopeptide repeat protein [Kouleothrix sp.]
MRREDLVLSTKLSPPRLRQRLLARPALAARLREALDYRLTVVQAGTGYGKTTALAGLAAEPTDLFWYSVAETDVDPQRFLSYLIAAFRLALPGFSNLPLAVLQERGGDGSPDAWPQALDALINALDESLRGPALLVLDDYHFVAGSLEIDSLMQRLVTYLPPDLHVILSTRHPLAWPDLVRWRARGELLEISREALAFRSEDIESLFHTTYGMQLSADEVDALANKTEGWPIALQLVWQGLRDSTARNAADLLAQSPTSLVALFEYLAYDVLDRQPPEVAGFLRQTAALRELTPAACDAVRGDCELALPAAPPPRAPTSHELLGRLHDLDLFVVALGERHYRYHHLFHDFLRQRLEADEREHRERHCRAARFFEAHGDDEEAIYHWLAAREFTAAAAAIGRAGEPALQSGRLDTVAAWIGAIPPEVLAAHPRLQVHLGDVFRLRTAFDPALECYMRAEQIWRAWGDLAGVSRALRGQALVYLDTVRPAQAESLLEEALRLSDSSGDRGSHARLIELLAENKLNMGKPDEAEALRSGARALREEPPDQDVLSVRVQLRTGRLDEAQRILEVWAEAERQAAERGQLHPPRSHRETVLILSLIHALRGQAGRALDLAMEGIALGERLGSPFVTTVAYTRRAHAEQLRRGPASQPDGRRTPDEAIRSYQTSIALGDRLAVRRIRSEAMWGLTRAYGFFGDLDSARRAAAEGIEVSEWAGDHWLVALTELALGASCALAGRHDEALEILARAQLAFRDCGDRLGRAATRLWLCLVYLDLRQSERFDACVADLLALCEANGYDFLFTAPSLLGPPDPRRVVPLLIAARARHRPAYVARLLASIGMPGIQVHPGYQLRVQTLGAFRVWRGDAGDRAARVAARQGPPAVPAPAEPARPLATARGDHRAPLAAPQARRGHPRLQGRADRHEQGDRARPHRRHAVRVRHPRGHLLPTAARGRRVARRGQLRAVLRGRAAAARPRPPRPRDRPAPGGAAAVWRRLPARRAVRRLGRRRARAPALALPARRRPAGRGPGRARPLRRRARRLPAHPRARLVLGARLPLEDAGLRPAGQPAPGPARLPALREHPRPGAGRRAFARDSGALRSDRAGRRAQSLFHLIVFRGAAPPPPRLTRFRQRVFFQGAAPPAPPARGNPRRFPRPPSGKESCLNFNASGACLSIFPWWRVATHRAWISEACAPSIANEARLFLGSRGASPGRGAAGVAAHPRPQGHGGARSPP